jgi:undecaprenyl-diphosphatase
MNEARPAAVAPRRTVRQRYPWLVPGGLLLLLTFLTVNVLVRGPLLGVDQQVYRAVRHTANSPELRWLKAGPATPARILVDLGNIRFAFPILLVIAGYAAFSRRSLRPLVTAVTGMLLIVVIVVPAKILIGRPNPGYAALPLHQLGAFPSGHTTAACVCCVLAALIATQRAGRRSRRIWLRAATALGVLVGLAMIWCSLHWLTDVIAGLALSGLLIPLTLWLTCRHGGQRRPGRPPPGEPRRLAAPDSLGAPRPRS